MRITEGWWNGVNGEGGEEGGGVGRQGRDAGSGLAALVHLHRALGPWYGIASLMKSMEDAPDTETATAAAAAAHRYGGKWVLQTGAFEGTVFYITV